MSRVFRPDRRAVLTGLGAALAAPALLRADDSLRFPNAFGEAVLKAPARRVVSLGYATQDSLLALGLPPVALRYWYGPYQDGLWPWAQPLAGSEKPVVLRGEPSAETIAGLAPDLIVAIGAALSAAEYQLLSMIAPVLVQPADVPVYGTPWQLELSLIGRAIGREAEAERLTREATAHFDKIRARNPHWQGRTAAAAWHDGGETGVFLAQDARRRFLRDMGFVDPPGYAGLTPISDFYANLSPEDLSPIDADLLVWISDAAHARDLAALPMRRTLRAVREGREVFAGEELGGALSFGSVLSLPWAIDRLEPEFNLALDGDPATPVPSAVENGLAG
ncbi:MULTISPECIES: ABC transporter substrate-binding protein [Pseudooceanicola]|uniref:ABC transporter substrate-binding protein n=1 Tax=Pseudooceanicola TaxID=1679449 RepID=UPI002880ABC5|nr:MULTISPECIES: ABC transporter substrate-binding protein [Pseudooceanicola]